MGDRNSILLTVVVATLMAAAALAQGQQPSKFKRVCYFTEWGQYRDGMKMLPGNVDPSLCTNIVYSYLDLTDTVVLQFPGDPADEAMMVAELISLKNDNPDLIVTAAVGGAGFDPSKYAELVQSRPSIDAFADYAVEFLRMYGFDGLEIDWHYPETTESESESRERFGNLITAVQAKFWEEEIPGDMKKLILSASVPVSDAIESEFDIPRICGELDGINLMTYDLHDDELTTGHNAPLDSNGRSLRKAVKKWKEHGCSFDKMTLGIPLFGKAFTLATPDSQYGASVSRPGNPGDYTQAEGYLAFYEICPLIASGVPINNEDAAAPALAIGDQWISYDDSTSVRRKARFAKEMGMAGINIWSLDTDDFTGACGRGPFPLLRAIVDELATYDNGDGNEDDNEDDNEDNSGDGDQEEKEHKRVCYYTNWSQYTQGMPFTPANIDPFVCTHIVYSFISMVNDELQLREWNGEALIAQLNGLKELNPKLKITVAIGGWSFGVEKFTNLVSSPERMKAFARKAAVFVRNYDFDGLDLDWEYPGARGSPPEDKQRFVQLIEILQEAFMEEAGNSGKEKLLLTAAVPVGTQTIEAGYMIPQVCNGLDAVHLMAYDIHGGGWESVTGHNAPLGGGDNNVMKGVDDWLNGGCTPDKLIMGVPTYGRSFTLLNTVEDGYGAPASNGKPSRYTQEAGYLPYYEICQLENQGGRRIWDEDVQAPVLVVGDQWIGYDGRSSIKRKVEFAKSRGLGGIMVWAIDLDDFTGICGKGKFPLLKTIQFVLDGDQVTPPTVSPTLPPTTTPSTMPQQDEKCIDDFGNPVSTNPFEIPGVCSHYQYCSSGYLLKAACPTGTVFNARQGFCDWPRNVPSCQDLTTSTPVTHWPTHPTHGPTRPTHEPTRPTHGPTRPTYRPTEPTHGPIHPTAGPIHPTPEPGCMTNRDWQKAMKKWRDDYSEWKSVFDRYMHQRRN